MSGYVNYNELYHFGVKGMKWGVRRYQNKDGSLTAEGRAKYINSDTGTLTNAGKKAMVKADNDYLTAWTSKRSNRGATTRSELKEAASKTSGTGVKSSVAGTVGKSLLSSYMKVNGIANMGYAVYNAAQGNMVYAGTSALSSVINFSVSALLDKNLEDSSYTNSYYNNYFEEDDD